MRKRLIWDACSKLHHPSDDRPAIFYGTGSEQRDWTHVDDVCNLVMESLKYQSDSLLFHNVGTGVATSNQTLISSITHLLKSNTPYVFNSQRPSYDPHSLVASIDDNPIHLPILTDVTCGISDYVQWFLNQQAQ